MTSQFGSLWGGRHEVLKSSRSNGQVSVCRAWNALPNNEEHKVEAIMEPFRSPSFGRHSFGHGFDLQVSSSLSQGLLFEGVLNGIVFVFVLVIIFLLVYHLQSCLNTTEIKFTKNVKAIVYFSPLATNIMFWLRVLIRINIAATKLEPVSGVIRI